MKLLIAGGGPVGAVLALGAARRGLDVVLIEAEADVDDSPRAATVHPSTLAMLGELGLMDEVIERGLVARYFDHWDRPTRTLIARLDHELLRDETPYPFVVQIEQHKIVRMVLDRLAGLDNVEVRLGTRVEQIEQDERGVRVTVVHDGETEVLSGDYLAGTDGGRSGVRKSQGIEFEGYTWPERFLVLTTLFDFQAEWDCTFRNYIADPEEWVNLFKVAGDDGAGRWRAVFPTTAEESDEDAVSDASVTRRLARLAAGANPADQLVHRKLYRVHQRVAASFRSGRVLLAGDAAHVNNPIGGLGLNCGIHDAMELVAALDEVERGAADERLDLYERRRRTLNIEFVQQQTIANKQRLEERDAERRAQRAAELAAVAADPERHRAFLRRSSLLDSVARARTLL
ncbi:MAG TPA: NAD(P)/FAD-dependent oxidoreductase [Gryllotalpicola sp.]